MCLGSQNHIAGLWTQLKTPHCPVNTNKLYRERCDLSCKKQFTVSSFLFIPQTSSDYETMMPGVRTEPELCCSCSAPDCAGVSALLPPPPDLCSHFTSKHRESTVTLGHEYVDVDVPGHICQYQHLDLSRLEEHVYHSLHGNSRPKDGPLGVKEQITCWFCWRIIPG